MKSKQLLLIFYPPARGLLFSGCQFRRGAGGQSVADPRGTGRRANRGRASPHPAAGKDARAHRHTAPTQDPEKARAGEAEQAARDYFAAVSEGKSDEAAGLLSRFSLMVFQMTQGDAASELQTQKIEGARWSDLEILEAQAFDAQTILVHVTYSAAKKAQTDVTPTPAADAAKEREGRGDKNGRCGSQG